MGLFNHSYEDTKQTVISNYLLCGGFAISPLIFSFFLKDKMIGSTTLAIASLVITVPLTAITTALAAMGVIGNSIYAAVALPTAQKDPLPALAAAVNEPLLSSSTQLIFQSIPGYDAPTSSPTVAPAMAPTSPAVNTQTATPYPDNDTIARIGFAR